MSGTEPGRAARWGNIICTKQNINEKGEGEIVNVCVDRGVFLRCFSKKPEWMGRDEARRYDSLKVQREDAKSDGLFQMTRNTKPSHFFLSLSCHPALCLIYTVFQAIPSFTCTLQKDISEVCTPPSLTTFTTFSLQSPTAKPYPPMHSCSRNMIFTECLSVHKK